MTSTLEVSYPSSFQKLFIPPTAIFTSWLLAALVYLTFTVLAVAPSDVSSCVSFPLGRGARGSQTTYRRRSRNRILFLDAGVGGRYWF